MLFFFAMMVRVRMIGKRLGSRRAGPGMIGRGRMRCRDDDEGVTMTRSVWMIWALILRRFISSRSLHQKGRANEERTLKHMQNCTKYIRNKTEAYILHVRHATFCFPRLLEVYLNINTIGLFIVFNNRLHFPFEFVLPHP